MAAVRQYGRWGFIDRTGKEAVPLIFEEVRGFCEGLASVKLYGKWGFIRADGTFVEPARESGKTERCRFMLGALGKGGE